MAVSQKRAKKTPARKPKTKNGNGQHEELRLTQLEQVELNLCERDWELSLRDIELADARLRNLAMDFQQKKAQLISAKETAQAKSEQLARIRNTKLTEIQKRLQTIEPDFDFKDYLEQEDGLLIPTEDKILSMDPTAGEGTPAGGDDQVSA